MFNIKFVHISSINVMFFNLVFILTVILFSSCTRYVTPTTAAKHSYRSDRIGVR